MLMLLFQVGDAPWAVAAAEVKDLMPLVTLQPLTPTAIEGMPEREANLAGLLNYHGDRIPVFDVSTLLGQNATTQSKSTRIALVEVATGDKSEPAKPASSKTTPTKQKLGLILDKAYETADLKEKVTIPTQDTYVQELLKGPAEQVVRRLKLSELLYPLT